MNKVILMGRLGGDPETRAVGGTSVTKFSVATSERWTDKGSGEKKERTDWHRCEAWGKTGEIIERFLHKGDQILLEGQIRVDQSEKDGEKRTFVSVRVDRFHFVGGGKREGGNEGGGGAYEATDDDVPF